MADLAEQRLPPDGQDANPPPFNIYSISDLCSTIDCNYSTVLVNCNYCSRVLSPFDCILFDYKDLKLLWKPELHVFVGICQPCLYSSALVQFIHGFEGIVSPEAAQDRYGRNLLECVIRCYKCMKPLTQAEIQTHIDCNEEFAVIVGRCRGICALCKLGAT
ncbi:E6 [Tadarida brasiliensis papillomavirus 2]|nr:E6 [Tadarida brasiliensis papillomavirus 2]